MPIRKIQFYPSEFYHIYNRGNGRQNIFKNDKDRYRFLQAIYLSNFCEPKLNIGFLERHKNGYTLADIEKLVRKTQLFQNPVIEIHADCLMPNHFHFLVQEIEPNGITKFMQRFGTSYSKYFSTKYDRPGSLFQGRFKAVHIESENQMKYLVAYINAVNPAQLIEPDLKNKGINNIKSILEHINSYKWSTHFEYLNKRNSILINKDLIKNLFSGPKEYMNFIKSILMGKENKIWNHIESISLE